MFEAFKRRCEEQLDKLLTSLTKVERDVTVLQSQWNTCKGTLKEFGEQLAPTQAAVSSLSERLAEMEAKEADIWAALKETRESLHELRSSRASDSESDSIGRLAHVSLCSFGNDVLQIFRCHRSRRSSR